jgi:hypothetical protein
MTGALKALYVDDVTIGMINSDMGFIGDESFYSRNKEFKLPDFATMVGVELNPRAYDQISGVGDDAATAVTVVINGRPYAADRCTNRTYFKCDDQEYSLPLSRVDVGKLLMGQRPTIRPTQPMREPLFHSMSK